MGGQNYGMRVRRVGRRALLIECSAPAEAQAWRAALWMRREQGELSVEEIVPGERTVLLDGVDLAIAERLGSWAPTEGKPLDDGPSVEIPTAFDGEDLPFVADRWGISGEAAVARLTETQFTVAFCGFTPGFAYMRGTTDWAVPRLEAPRPRVPAGAVALAGPYTGIYPTASPGGWRLVGHTRQTLFDVRAEPPALLSPGTRVRLTAVR
jgi:KipI family sensor histidine kinase inhibitor